jgi:hypothetical protein
MALCGDAGVVVAACNPIRPYSAGRKEQTEYSFARSGLPIVFPTGLAGKILCEKCLILLDQKRSSGAVSAVPKADIGGARRDVRFVPKADIHGSFRSARLLAMILPLLAAGDSRLASMCLN